MVEVISAVAVLNLILFPGQGSQGVRTQVTPMGYTFETGLGYQVVESK